MFTRSKLLSTAVALFAAGLALAMPATSATAQEFPSKPLQFIVPYAPGGPLDGMARMLAEKVQPDLGTVVVENKPGAGGNIGASIAAKAQPDGYTLVMGAVAINAINPWLYKDLPFDPVKSFEPVTLVASVPNVLIVNKEFADKNGIASVKDLVEYAKKNADQLNFGSGGNGSAGHLAGELMNVRAGVKSVHVPYAGAAPAKLALLGGQVHFMFDNLASSAGLINEGKVKALAVTTAERSSAFPDLPTMQQAGVADFDLGTWFGVFTTGGTPEAVVQKLNAAYVKALQDPAVRKTLLSMGSDAKPTTSEEFAELVRKDLAKYKEIVAVSGAKLF
ncbi:Bug family tripartite tricarboxylate transporter substrate binding protein [Parapusillimonas granuli]|uniref:Tripartite tricarboxylate transporter substrate binding protein n=1 Tax=Parapusillimonas granuli TaxID=380911 RepID=A0A853G1I0_9BURK|nr:tripartite tricarboxylate transporter substrate binding protein [Parapusillimonas granuli]MBB5215797.1 tripartite-type tricarboxylate transporter receptor subunit TctC [Parapusillimonas granuli]MEB2399512.1 tripartite tricarboxylate transporter substrate binding protein [Alcaligenaceae bacterium]NYT51138.1 tripartite tricarboxylate transporter substrate binding protein [Parapusillimonas granuli]